MKASELNKSWQLLPKEVQKNKIEYLEKTKPNHQIEKLKVFVFEKHSEVIHNENIKYFSNEEQAVNYCLDLLNQ